MNHKIRCMNRVGRSAVGELRAREVKSHAVGAGHHVDESLEVRVANWPLGWREAVVEAANGDCTIDRLLRGVPNCAVNQEDLLIDLGACKLSGLYGPRDG